MGLSNFPVVKRQWEQVIWEGRIGEEVSYPDYQRGAAVKYGVN